MSEADTQQSPEPQASDELPGREDDGQEYLDRSKLDFDPDDGLYSGTAVDGSSEIPGPHEADGYSESGDQVELGDQADAAGKHRAGDETSED